MRILYLLNNDDQYGAPKSTLRMIEILKDKYEVAPIVITPFRNKNNQWCDEREIENYSIPYMNTTGRKNGNIIRNGLKKSISLFLDFLFFIKIRKRVDLKKVDFIHSSVAGITSGFYTASRLDIKHIWHMREIPTTWYYLRKNQIDKINNTSNTKLIAISESVKKEWIDEGIDSKKIVKVYNGIDKNTISIRKKEQKSDRVKIIVAGNLIEYKQPDVAIIAIGMLPVNLREYVQIDFYGSAEKGYMNYLESLVNKYGVQEQVHFMGYCNNVTTILGNYDIGLMNSVSEAFGRSTVEYMLASLCVIASDSGANAELIDDNEEGLLYKQGNPKDLKRQIEKIINNRGLIDYFGTNARSKAEREFLDSSNAKNVNDIYLSMRGNNESY